MVRCRAVAAGEKMEMNGMTVVVVVSFGGAPSRSGGEFTTSSLISLRKLRLYRRARKRAVLASSKSHCRVQLL